MKQLSGTSPTVHFHWLIGVRTDIIFRSINDSVRAVSRT